ncbi:orf120 [Sucra jujuba nucleopolyhedrovirus]|uniref:Orf120 n=1 Tax=Sucra jujuba nucleopolyhedrovirus TaxID=1563660 RepID=A0A097P975_9ABAC|nr:orf120 [Sucra jujuba nucleopolyhedrovirus]AIU41359.1 orf120 [Sucra jujuba nucleopolyhedrovirus]
MALYVILFVLCLFDNSKQILLLNATGGEIEDENRDIDHLFNMIMVEVTKIQKNESNDYSYTRIIFILLIVFFIITLKIKLYKYMNCNRKRAATPALAEEKVPLEKITIKELNYNFNNS